MKGLLIAALVLCVAGPVARAADPADVLLDDALRAMAMTRADLSFRTDYADRPDSFRIAAVDSLLDRPLDTERYVVTVADDLSETATLDGLVARCSAEVRAQ